MTYAIQAVAGIVIALGTMLGVYRQKIRSLLFRSGSRNSQNSEPDVIEFHDPATGTVREVRHIAEGKKEPPAAPASALAPGILLACASAFMLLFYAPLELYFTNVFEFEYDVHAIFRYILLLSVIGAAILSLIMAILHKGSKKLYDAVLVLGTGIFLACYVQGNFLISDLPPADGRPIDWSQYQSQNRLSLIVWAVMILLCILLGFVMKKKFRTFTSAVSLLVSGILAITLITVCIQNNGLQRKPVLCVSHEGLNEMSSDENFVIFVVDAVDSKTFQDLMETEDPDFRDVFEDFTYYPDTLAAYPYTMMAIPQLLTGEWYTAQDDFRAYYTRAMKSSALLSRVRDEQYVRGIYDVMDVVFDDPEFFEYENIQKRPFELGNVRTFLADEVRMSFYLYAPWPLKKYEPYALFNLQNQPAADYYYQWYDPWIFHYFEDHPIVTRPEKVFRFIHTEGAHPPMRYDKNLNDVEDTPEACYEANIEAAVTVLNRYLTSLKEAGVYDNTAIVILADHGYDDQKHSSGRQNPLFLIKGRNESHPMTVSEEPITYDYLPEIYQNLLDGRTGIDALPEDRDPSAPRRYMHFDYGNETHIVEMELVNAKAAESSALKGTGRVFDR